MTSVLAAVDLSPLARRVADRARIVAETHGVDLNLLHVAESAGDALVSPDVMKMILDHRRLVVDQLLEWMRGRTMLQVHGEVAKGSAVWEIVKADRSSELTVVGSSAVDHSHIGPVASGVATYSRNDVLVVRRQPRTEYRRVVIAVDLSVASLAAVERVPNLFPDADVTVAFSLPSRFDTLMEGAGMFPAEVEASREERLAHAATALDSLLEKRGWDFRTLVVDGSPIETMSEVVRRRSADLLVVSNRGAGATKLTLLGTVASGVLGACPTDVLVVRVPSEFRRP